MIESEAAFVISINENLCSGCWDCIQQCPERVLGFKEDSNSKGAFPATVLKPNLCTGCRKCQEACNYGLIDIEVVRSS